MFDTDVTNSSLSISTCLTLNFVISQEYYSGWNSSWVKSLQLPVETWKLINEFLTGLREVGEVASFVNSGDTLHIIDILLWFFNKCLNKICEMEIQLNIRVDCLRIWKCGKRGNPFKAVDNMSNVRPNISRCVSKAGQTLMKTLKQLGQSLVPPGTSCLSYPRPHPFLPLQPPDPGQSMGRASHTHTVDSTGRNANTRHHETRLAPKLSSKDNNQK